MKLFGEKTKKDLQKNDCPKYIETLDKKNFKDFIESYNICLIDFWASWCQPCKKMGPRIRQLSKRFEGKVAFGKLNVEKNKSIEEEYKVMSIPTLILFVNGKEKATLTGLKTVGELKKIINKYL